MQVLIAGRKIADEEELGRAWFSTDIPEFAKIFNYIRIVGPMFGPLSAEPRWYMNLKLNMWPFLSKRAKADMFVTFNEHRAEIHDMHFYDVPEEWVLWNFLGRVMYGMGRYDAALEAMRLSMDKDLHGKRKWLDRVKEIFGHDSIEDGEACEWDNNSEQSCIPRPAEESLPYGARGQTLYIRAAIHTLIRSLPAAQAWHEGNIAYVERKLAKRSWIRRLID
jgi:hypothetical protein